MTLRRLVRFSNPKTAVSMVELLVALAVLGAVIAPLAASFWGISRGFRKVTSASLALMLARSVLDHGGGRLTMLASDGTWRTCVVRYRLPSESKYTGRLPPGEV